MRRPRRPRAAEGAAAAALLLLLGTACGSRLPESDFEHGGRSNAPASTGGTPVRVGIITSATSPVGGNTFTGPRDGAKAYFDQLNAPASYSICWKRNLTAK